MTVFRTAAQWLQQKRLDNATVPVTYKRGGDSLAMEAQVGLTVYEEVDADGVVIRFESRDYLIALDEFEAPITMPPQIGDEIEETQDSATYTYRVTSIPGGQAYRRDAHRLRVRIHTKRTSAE